MDNCNSGTVFVVTTLLLCGLIHCHSSHNDSVSDNVPILSQSRDIDEYLDGPLNPVYEMTEFALESVIQPNYLTDLEEDIGKEFVVPDDFLESFEDNWEEWVVYFMGYTVLASIGVLLILFVPLVGMIVACCRCCGNCGGRPRAMEGKCSVCKRVCCGVTFFIVTSAITLGVICMFAFNAEISQRIYTEEGNIWDELSSNLKNVEKYFDDTVDEMDTKILDEYVVKKDVLIKMLEEIPTDAVGFINNETEVLDDLNELLSFSNNLTYINESLTTATHLQGGLNKTLLDLEIETEELRIETFNLLSNCTTVECEEVKNATADLSVNMTTSGIQLENVTILVQISLEQNLVQEIEASFDEIDRIIQAINSSIDDEIQEVLQYADDIQEEIEEFINDTARNLDKLDINVAVDALEEVKENISEEVVIAYWAVVALGIPLCIIVFCGFVGLCLGIVCPRPSPNTGCCSSDRTMGSDALLTGVGFTFIFYWIYAMIVLVIFLAGGVTHTEVCRHLVNYDVTESAGVIDIMDRMAMYQLNESLDVVISPFNAYESCADNKSFYTALELANNGYNISEIIDTTEIKEAIDEIKTVPIDIPTVNIMNDTVQQALNELGEEFDKLDFDLYYQHLDGPVTTVSLLDIIDLLEVIRYNGTIDDTEVQNLMDQFTEAQNSLVQPAETLALNLTHELQVIEDLLPRTPLMNITNDLKEDEAIINDSGNTLVGKFINTTADDLYEETVAFTNQMISTVEEDLGRCKPLYNSLTGTIDSVCVKTLYPLNGFWFSLGWCLFFLVPSIIIAFILADEYRKAHPYMEGIDTNFEDPGQGGYDAYAGVPDYWTFDNSPNNGVQMYPLPRVELQPAHNKTQAKPHMSNNSMAAFDNPLYSNDEELKIPRPTVIPTPYYPPSTLQRKQQQDRDSPSPPPSYRDAVDSDERTSHDDNYDTRM